MNAPVSLRFLPRTMMVSPRKSWRVSIVAGLSCATELSSEVLSSTIKRLGLYRDSTHRAGEGGVACASGVVSGGDQR